MVAFDAAHKKVHYPDDRRHRLWIDPRLLYCLLALILVVLAVAWIQRFTFGMPHIPIDAAQRFRAGAVLNTSFGDLGGI
jgi:hypothetical protein